MPYPFAAEVALPLPYRDAVLSSNRSFCGCGDRTLGGDAFHLSQRRAPRPSDEVLHRSPDARGTNAARQRHERDHPTTLVCLGPGHRWPAPLSLLLALRQIPVTRTAAERLGMVTLRQMTQALARAVESPAQGVRVFRCSRHSRPKVTAAQVDSGTPPTTQG